MTRTLKPLSIGNFSNAATGLSVPILIDRRTYWFFATISGQRYEAATMGELETIFRQAASSSTRLDWRHIIRIEITRQTAHQPETPALKLTANHFLLAQDALGNLLKTSAEAEPEDRLRLSEKFYWPTGADNPLEQAPAVAKISDSYSERTIIVRLFSDGDWLATTQIKARLRAFGEGLTLACARAVLTPPLPPAEAEAEIVFALRAQMRWKMRDGTPCNCLAGEREGDEPLPKRMPTVHASHCDVARAALALLDAAAAVHPDVIAARAILKSRKAARKNTLDKSAAKK